MISTREGSERARGTIDDGADEVVGQVELVVVGPAVYVGPPPNSHPPHTVTSKPVSSTRRRYLTVVLKILLPVLSLPPAELCAVITTIFPPSPCITQIAHMFSPDRLTVGMGFPICSRPIIFNTSNEQSHSKASAGGEPYIWRKLPSPKGIPDNRPREVLFWRSSVLAYASERLRVLIHCTPGKMRDTHNTRCTADLLAECSTRKERYLALAPTVASALARALAHLCEATHPRRPMDDMRWTKRSRRSYPEKG